MVCGNRRQGEVGSEFIHAPKAPDPDGIYPICLQIGLDLTMKHLIKVYKGSIAMGHIPKSLREVNTNLSNNDMSDFFDFHFMAHSKGRYTHPNQMVH